MRASRRARKKGGGGRKKLGGLGLELLSMGCFKGGILSKKAVFLRRLRREGLL